jgi:hypothetical protein
LVNEWVTSSETSSESSESEEEKNKKITSIAIMDDKEPPLPPPPLCFMAKHSKVNYKARGSHWILDSGCTQHMTGQVKMFTSLVDDAGDHEQVSFGDNSKGRISGLGEISLTNDLSLSNVLYVDSCSCNLLSIAQFCDLSLSCTFDDEGVTITNKKTNEVVFKGFRYGNLYLVDFASHEANLTTYLISKTSKGWLWHRRIAHIGMSQLKKAFKKGMVLGVKDVTFEKDKLCSACQVGKQVTVIIL